MSGTEGRGFDLYSLGEDKKEGGKRFFVPCTGRHGTNTGCPASSLKFLNGECHHPLSNDHC